MADNFFAAPDRLHAVAPKFESLGEEVNSALESLKSELCTVGKCWGTDEPGKQFEKGYPSGDAQGGPEATLTALATLVKALKATGDKITAAATVITDQDQANAAGIAAQSAQL